MRITLDAKNINKKSNFRYRGIGMVSANNSSRLLLDYRDENPEIYRRIMEYMFDKRGLNICHLKLEMGSDINSSSGTEPSIMRSESEKADISRGAGFAIAADAKKINPDLTLDMLWWSEPAWISDSDDVYAARYKWYKAHLDSAYEEYGLVFDYVSSNQNERYVDCDWIKYLSKALKSEKNCPYDYSKIKIVAGDEVCTWNIAEAMLCDKELISAVDVVGSHYTSCSTEQAQLLAREYGKELWFSEASSPMSYMRGFLSKNLSGINGVLDIASRIAAMYPCGKMTLCQLQPVISAYYDGTTYCCKQLISACDPWSGYYVLDSGFYMMLHFSLFLQKGWSFIEDACFCDAKVGGDGHALVDGKYCYMSACDENTGDYSVIIVNSTDKPIDYGFKIKSLKITDVNLWETRGSDNGRFDENYFKLNETITPCRIENDDAEFSVRVNPNSIITLSTLCIGIDKSFFINCDESMHTVLPLPYSDDYNYSNYSADYLAKRGFAPRYMTDMGGAFEVVNNSYGKKCVMQKITSDIKPCEWGWTPEPVTSMGDDRWCNYSVSTKIHFDVKALNDSNYAGVGLRYNLSDIGHSGYWLQLFANGRLRLNKCDNILFESVVENLDCADWIDMKITAFGKTIKAYINNELLAEYVADNKSVIYSGRVAYFSSHNRNCFAGLLVEQIDNEEYCIERCDDTDSCFEYIGNWNHEAMSSFKNYKRTVSSAMAGNRFILKFEGTSVALCGFNDDAEAIRITIDGNVVEEHYNVPKTSYREAFYLCEKLDFKKHLLEAEILSGRLNIDMCEIMD